MKKRQTNARPLTAYRQQRQKRCAACGELFACYSDRTLTCSSRCRKARSRKRARMNKKVAAAVAKVKAKAKAKAKPVTPDAQQNAG